MKKIFLLCITCIASNTLPSAVDNDPQYYVITNKTTGKLYLAPKEPTLVHEVIDIAPTISPALMLIPVVNIAKKMEKKETITNTDVAFLSLTALGSLLINEWCRYNRHINNRKNHYLIRQVQQDSQIKDMLLIEKQEQLEKKIEELEKNIQ